MTTSPLVPGAPDLEHSRSPVALRTAQLSAESALFLAHFEHRALLPWPEDLCPPHLPQLADPATWQRGKLVEDPYASFRHDRMVGSFHPGHRAKWTAHELVHLLVGFAYRPGESRFFHALSAWLAELLPVAVYYFFDEVGLRRCPVHEGQGPLFGSYCAACERAALEGPRERTAQDEAAERAGRAYLDAELAAIARARRTGLPHGHRHATLDLCSDGMGYAGAHALRLDSALFERFTRQFFAPDQGLHDGLDALEARVLAVAAALTEGTPLPAWQASAGDWVAQDIGYRLLEVQWETEGEAESELDALIDALADRDDPERVSRVVEGYVALTEEWHLPEASELFGLGYPVAFGHGSAIAQLSAGVESALPNTHAQLEYPEDWLVAFATEDLRSAERTPLGRRFARWVAREEGDALADLARYEAALTHAAPADPAADALDAADESQEGLRLAEGVELLELRYDVLEEGDVAEATPLDPPSWIAVRTNASGELTIAELSPEVAAALRDGPALEWGALGEAAAQLAELGFIVPARYA